MNGYKIGVPNGCSPSYLDCDIPHNVSLKNEKRPNREIDDIMGIGFVPALRHQLLCYHLCFYFSACRI